MPTLVYTIMVHIVAGVLRYEVVIEGIVATKKDAGDLSLAAFTGKSPISFDLV